MKGLRAITEAEMERLCEGDGCWVLTFDGETHRNMALPTDGTYTKKYDGRFGRGWKFYYNSKNGGVKTFYAIYGSR